MEGHQEEKKTEERRKKTTEKRRFNNEGDLTKVYITKAKIHFKRFLIPGIFAYIEKSV